ncbi:inactive pancreatic lipase-related protein 1-like isoform X2 [Littorina saxatilis]|uniref:Lipase domain-containing protein n=1 Tax=Littorina saxatilis TaxID=31220 RepID=A0AAN9B6L4_9CAEN
MLLFVVLCALLTGAQAGLLDIFDSKVCYGVLGCFRNDAPFTNSWRELPNSPEKIGVSLTLYTRANPLEGDALDWRNTENIISRTHFDPNAEVKVIIHGYMNDGMDYWVVNMTRALLQAGHYNVIKVAWGPGAHAVYPKAVANTRVVGAVTAHFLTSLRNAHNVSMSRVHLMGHSLGAHIAGYVGSDARGIARISGMDPAGPLFESTDPAVRIDSTDADLVDCIHSDGVPLEDMGFGTLSAWCDVDFYPNGGGHQAGCPKPVSGAILDVFSMNMLGAETAVSCSHSRSHDLYVDSIITCTYPSSRCDSYAKFKAGKCACNSPSSCASMGYRTSKSTAPGKYYLVTTGTEPFC